MTRDEAIAEAVRRNRRLVGAKARCGREYWIEVEQTPGDWVVEHRVEHLRRRDRFRAALLEFIGW